MKKFCGILCLLALFWELSYAIPRSSRSLQCEEALKRNTSPLEERKEQILALIRENRYITIAQIAKELGVSKSTVTRAITLLEKENRLKRHGRKGGHWEILQERDKFPPHNDPSEAVWVKVIPDDSPEELTESDWIEATKIKEEPSFLNDLSKKITRTIQKKVPQTENEPSPYKDPLNDPLEEITGSAWEMIQDEDTLFFYNDQLEKITEEDWWVMQDEDKLFVYNYPLEEIIESIQKKVPQEEDEPSLQSGEQSLRLSPKERKEQILALKKANPYITPTTLANEIGVLVSTVYKDIAKLIKEEQLEESKPRRSISPEEIIEPIQEMMRESPQITRVQLAQKTGALISTVDKAIAILIKETIWELTEENPDITIAELVQKTGLEIPTVNATIDILEEEKGVVRSRTRGEFWKRLKEGEEPPHSESPEEREEKVLALIAENPYITNAQIAEKLGLSKRIIDQTTTRLTRKKQLKRHGTRGGWREIL